MAPSLEGGSQGGRVCAVITITATANANWKPLATHSGATLRDSAFPVPPLPFSTFAHFPPTTRGHSRNPPRKFWLYICRVCFFTARATRDVNRSGWRGDVCWPDKETQYDVLSRTFHPSTAVAGPSSKVVFMLVEFTSINSVCCFLISELYLSDFKTAETNSSSA